MAEKKDKKPTDKLADKTLLTRILQGVFGDAQKKILCRYGRHLRVRTGRDTSD